MLLVLFALSQRRNRFIVLAFALALGSSVMSLRQQSLQSSLVAKHFGESALVTVQLKSDPHQSELHAVYHLLSVTNNQRIRLEVSVPDIDPHIPSLVEVWGGSNWNERETFDMFGIIFDGHPGLTRILMPDDWQGHPQRKDYALGGIGVEYKGAVTPPPSDRRSYK